MGKIIRIGGDDAMGETTTRARPKPIESAGPGPSAAGPSAPLAPEPARAPPASPPARAAPVFTGTQPLPAGPLVEAFEASSGASASEPFELDASGALEDDEADLSLLLDWSSQLPSGTEEKRTKVSAQEFMRSLVSDLVPAEGAKLDLSGSSGDVVSSAAALVGHAESLVASAAAVPEHGAAPSPSTGASTPSIPAEAKRPAPPVPPGAQRPAPSGAAASSAASAATAAASPGSAQPHAPPAVPAAAKAPPVPSIISPSSSAPPPPPAAAGSSLAALASGQRGASTPPATPTPATVTEAPGVAAPKAGERRTPAWWETLFDEDWLRTNPAKSPAMTAKEASFIEATLNVPKGARVLDLACGYGRHALDLAARGYQVVGLDLSLPYLMLAADLAQQRGVAVSFVHGDMRELSFVEMFDACYCMYESFGYFEDATNLKVLKGIARALKPGGKLLLQVTNRDFVVNEMPVRGWWEGIGCMLLEEVDFNFFKSVLVTRRSVVFEDGRQGMQKSAVRLYSLHELGRALGDAGFKVLEVSGAIDHRGVFLGASSREMLLLCDKRADATERERNVFRELDRTPVPPAPKSSAGGVGGAGGSGAGADRGEDKGAGKRGPSGAAPPVPRDARKREGDVEEHRALDEDDESTPTIRTAPLPKMELDEDEEELDAPALTPIRDDDDE